MVKAESPACTLNTTSSQVVASVWCERVSKSSDKIVELGAYGSVKDSALSKEKLKSLAERLCGPLQLPSVDRIVTQSSSHQEGLTTVPV